MFPIHLIYLYFLLLYFQVGVSYSDIWCKFLSGPTGLQKIYFCSGQRLNWSTCSLFTSSPYLSLLFMICQAFLFTLHSVRQKTLKPTCSLLYTHLSFLSSLFYQHIASNACICSVCVCVCAHACVCVYGGDAHLHAIMLMCLRVCVCGVGVGGRAAGNETPISIPV